MVAQVAHVSFYSQQRYISEHSQTVLADHSSMAYGPALYHQDGRPVGFSLLQGEQKVTERRRKGPKEPEDGWQRSALWEKKVPFGEDDEAQLERALRSGRGRRRRFFHDRLLRDIAGRNLGADKLFFC